MRDPARIRPFLDRLEKLWLAYPDLRLGQLILNWTGDDHLLYFAEDDTLLAGLENLYQELNKG